MCCFGSCWSTCLQNNVCTINTDVYVPEYYVNFCAESTKLNKRWLNSLNAVACSFLRVYLMVFIQAARWLWQHLHCCILNKRRSSCATFELCILTNPSTQWLKEGAAQRRWSSCFIFNFILTWTKNCVCVWREQQQCGNLWMCSQGWPAHCKITI